MAASNTSMLLQGGSWNSIQELVRNASSESHPDPPHPPHPKPRWDPFIPVLTTLLSDQIYSETDLKISY